MIKIWTPPLTLFSYLAKNYIIKILIALLVLICLITFIDVIEFLRKTGERQIEISLLKVISITLLKIPSQLDNLLPFSVIFGSITCFYLWNKNNEFLQARTSGQNIWQAISPVIFSLTAIGIINIIIINPIAATTIKQHDFLLSSIFGKKSVNEMSISTSGIWIRDTKIDYDLFINGDQLELNDAIIKNPTVYHLQKNGQLTWRMQAKQIFLTNGGWIINNAIKTENSGLTSKLGNIIIPTEMDPSDLSESNRSAKTINIYRLPNFINVLEKAGLPADKHKVLLHQIISTPFKLIGLAILTASFTLIKFSRKTEVKLIFLSMVISFGFYFLSDLIYILGNSAKIPYLLAGWGPSLIICAFGGFFLARVDE